MVKIIFLFTICFVCGNFVFAQYPFEKYKSPVGRAVPKWVDSLATDGKSTTVAVSTLSLDSVFSGGDKCVIRVESESDNELDGSKISIFRNGKLLQVFVDDDAPHYLRSGGSLVGTI